MRDNKYVLKFPDGFTAKYAQRWSKGYHLKWFLDLETSTFLGQLKKEKKDQPKLGFWNSGGEYAIVCGDIDSLPDGFSDYDGLEVWLQESSGDNLVVSRSSSGKVKVFCLVHFPELNRLVGFADSNRRIKELSLACLSELIDPRVIEVIDLNQAAFLYSFVNERLVADLRKVAESNPSCVVSYSGASIEILVTKNDAIVELPDGDESSLRFHRGSDEKRNFSYRRYENELPEFARNFVVKYKSSCAGIREEFMRILLATNSLSHSGFDLPVTSLSEHLKTTTKNVSNWNKRLVKLGLLTELSGNYAKGKKAKRYQAAGELLLFLEQNQSNKVSKLWVPPVGYEVPSQISDGKWGEETYKAIVYHFSDDFEGYLSWLKSLKGHQYKGRLKEAVSRWHWYMENQFRKTV